MSLSKVTRNYQITIPSGIRRALHIKVGSLVDFVMDKKQVILKPKAVIDDNQSWFWSEEWQAAEKEGDGEVEKGEVSPTFQTAEEGIEWLKK